MITLNSLKTYRGARKRRKVVGRGLGSGKGTYSTRGAKGQKARKSGGVRPGFEGGRQPLIRQVPKLRGFKSHNPKMFGIAVSKLNRFADGDIVDLQALQKMKMVSSGRKVKILAGGELSKKLEVHLPVSAAAQALIEKAGGSVA